MHLYMSFKYTQQFLYTEIQNRTYNNNNNNNYYYYYYYNYDDNNNDSKGRNTECSHFHSKNFSPDEKQSISLSTNDNPQPIPILRILSCDVNFPHNLINALLPTHLLLSSTYSFLQFYTNFRTTSAFFFSSITPVIVSFHFHNSSIFSISIFIYIFELLEDLHQKFI